MTSATIAAKIESGQELRVDELAALVAAAIRAPAVPPMEAMRERNRLIGEYVRRFLWDAPSLWIQAIRLQNAIERFERTTWRSTGTAWGATRSFFSAAHSQLTGITWSQLMARPKLEFDDKDRQLVDALIRYGVPAAAVAREMAIDEKTLAKHFGVTITKARAQRQMAQIVNLWHRARRGSVRAMIKLDRMMRVR